MTIENTPVAAAALFDGIPVRISGTEYILPAMSAKTSRKHWPDIERMQAGGPDGERMPLPDQVDLTITLVHECLQRNYPGISRDVVADHVDVSNHNELSAMVFGRGAWLRWMTFQADLARVGNGVTASPEGNGTGDPSTLPSSPSPDGDSPTSMH